jgi:hypothetical protein
MCLVVNRWLFQLNNDYNDWLQFTVYFTDDTLFRKFTPATAFFCPPFCRRFTARSHNARSTDAFIWRQGNREQAGRSRKLRERRERERERERKRDWLLAGRLLPPVSLASSCNINHRDFDVPLSRRLQYQGGRGGGRDGNQSCPGSFVDKCRPNVAEQGIKMRMPKQCKISGVYLYMPEACRVKFYEPIYVLSTHGRSSNNFVS